MIISHPVPPRWILEPTDKAFAQGSNAKVECKADGFPKPQVTWKMAVGKTFQILLYAQIASVFFIRQETNLVNTKTFGKTTPLSALKMET